MTENLLGEKSALEETISGVNEEGYEDPSGAYPKKDYYNRPTTNMAARGMSSNKLNIASTYEGIDLDIKEHARSQYPLNKVTETVTGHVIELDDTLGSQRVLIKHKEGSGIDLRDDGSIIINSKGNTIRISGGDEKVIIEGKGEVVYKGGLKIHAKNLDLDVDGDFNLTANNINMKAKNDFKKEVKNAHEEYSGGLSQIITDNFNRTVLKSSDIINKGSVSYTNEETTFIKTPVLDLNVETLFSLATKRTEVITKKLFLGTDSGTIAGTDLIYQGKSATFTAGVTAPSFHGSLKGTADQAIIADETNYQNYLASQVGSKQGYSNTDTATVTNTTVSSAVVTDWLDNSELGLCTVVVDPDNKIKNALDKTNEFGIISFKPNIDIARSLLKEPKNKEDSKFVPALIANEIISESVANPMPNKSIEETADNKAKDKTGTLPMGFDKGARIKKILAIKLPSEYVISVDPEYNPDNNLSKTSKLKGFFGFPPYSVETKLSNKTTIAKFLGIEDVGTWKNFTTAKKAQIARNFYYHTQILESVPYKIFDNLSLAVSEGLYSTQNLDILTPGTDKYLARSGRCIAYKLIGLDGKIDVYKTFKLAEHWSSYVQYEKLILDYDTLNPDGSLTVQIIVHIPEIPNTYKAIFNKNLETRWNFEVLAKDELVQIREY